MKKITKLFAFLLSLCLIFSLTACSGSATIEGSWKYTLDFTKVLEAMEQANAEKEQDPDDAAAAKSMSEAMAKAFEGMTMVMILDLNEDKTFTMTTDEEALKEATDKMEERLPEILPEIVAAMSGMTVEELEAAAKEAGKSMDDMIAEAGEMFNAEDIIENARQDPVKGTYTYEEGKLVLTPDNDSKPVTFTVELSAAELKVTGIEGEDIEEDGLEYFLPVIFVR